MPRGPRLDAPGILHHVMVRGIEQRDIFRRDEDRVDFVRRLARLLPATQTPCFAWALLSNHAHLLLRSGPHGVAQLMRRLLTGYAVSFNRRYGRVGHLFQNRYRSMVCEEEPYLLALVRYIHLNPFRAGMVSSLRELARFPWCGHSALLGRVAVPWQQTSDVLERFARSIPSARRRYEAFVADGLEAGEDVTGQVRAVRAEADGDRPDLGHRQVNAAGQYGAILGSPEFVARLLTSLNRDPVRPATECRSVILAVCRVLGVSPNAIASGQRTRPLSDARAVIAYLGRTLHRIPGSDLARALGTTQPAVVRAERRGERLLDQRQDLRRALGELVN